MMAMKKSTTRCLVNNNIVAVCFIHLLPGGQSNNCGHAVDPVAVGLYGSKEACEERVGYACAPCPYCKNDAISTETRNYWWLAAEMAKGSVAAPPSGSSSSSPLSSPSSPPLSSRPESGRSGTKPAPLAQPFKKSGRGQPEKAPMFGEQRASVAKGRGFWGMVYGFFKKRK